VERKAAEIAELKQKLEQANAALQEAQDARRKAENAQQGTRVKLESIQKELDTAVTRDMIVKVFQRNQIFF